MVGVWYRAVIIRQSWKRIHPFLLTQRMRHLFILFFFLITMVPDEKNVSGCRQNWQHIVLWLTNWPNDRLQSCYRHTIPPLRSSRNWPPNTKSLLVSNKLILVRDSIPSTILLSFLFDFWFYLDQVWQCFILSLLIY